MRIDKIRIKNFKGFEDETFELPEQFTVFIGDNASGKTSVLEAISFVADSFLSGIGMNNIWRNSLQARVITIDGQPKNQFPVLINSLGSIDDTTIELTLNANERKRAVNPEIINDAKRLKILEQLSVFIKAEKIGFSEIAKKKLEESRSHSGVIFPIIAYYSTVRLWKEEKKIPFEKQEEGIHVAYKNCLPVTYTATNFISWIKTQEDSIQKFQDSLEIAHLKAMKNAILSLMPDNRWQDIAFDRKREELSGIFYDSSGKTNRLSFGQLSDGFRNAVSMAADIAYRCIQLNPHFGERAVLDTPGIVLIDEIDLHLHPNWQRHFIGDLKKAFPKIQFVATTHSPFIVQSLKASELINLDAVSDVNPSDLSIEDISTHIMGVESNFGAESQKEELLSREYLTILNKENSTSNEKLDMIEKKVTDPAVRAFLQMQRLIK